MAEVKNNTAAAMVGKGSEHLGCGTDFCRENVRRTKGSVGQKKRWASNFAEMIMVVVVVVVVVGTGNGEKRN